MIVIFALSKSDSWLYRFEAMLKPQTDVYYNSMWQAVQDEQKTGGQQAKDYYIKTSVITDKRQRNRFLASGVIYRNEKIRDYMNQIKSDIDKGIT